MRIQIPMTCKNYASTLNAELAVAKWFGTDHEMKWVPVTQAGRIYVMLLPSEKQITQAIHSPFYCQRS